MLHMDLIGVLDSIFLSMLVMLIQYISKHNDTTKKNSIVCNTRYCETYVGRGNEFSFGSSTIINESNFILSFAMNNGSNLFTTNRFKYIGDNRNLFVSVWKIDDHDNSVCSAAALDITIGVYYFSR